MKALLWLVGINILLFLALRLPGGADMVSWLELPADLPELVKKPWTLLSFGFIQLNYWHLASNLLWLCFLGLPWLCGIKGWRLTGVYLAGTVVGGVAFVIVANCSGNSSANLCGASSAVVALAAYFLLTLPRRWQQTLALPRKFLVLALVLLILAEWIGAWSETDVVPASSSLLSLAAHLGGIVGGTACFFIMRRARSESLPVEPRPLNVAVAREALIEKARKSGYSSLTARERVELLNQSSDERR